MKSASFFFTAVLFSVIFTGCIDFPNSANNHATDGLSDDYEDFGRVIWQKPGQVIGMFSDLSNKTIADIGAGTGFFSKRLATKAKKVIAIDIDERFIYFLDSIRTNVLPEEARNKLEPRLSKMDDPLLKEGEVDAVLIVNTFMYMSDRVDYLKKIANALPPNGEILIVDFKNSWTPVGPPVDIRLAIDNASTYLEDAGFEIVKKDEKLLEYQYAILAKKKE